MDFIKKLLITDPALRLTASKALLHPWLNHLFLESNSLPSLDLTTSSKTSLSSHTIAESNSDDATLISPSQGVLDLLPNVHTNFKRVVEVIRIVNRWSRFGQHHSNLNEDGSKGLVSHDSDGLSLSTSQPLSSLTSSESSPASNSEIFTSTLYSPLEESLVSEILSKPSSLAQPTFPLTSPSSSPSTLLASNTHYALYKTPLLPRLAASALPPGSSFSLDRSTSLRDPKIQARVQDTLKRRASLKVLLGHPQHPQEEELGGGCLVRSTSQRIKNLGGKISRGGEISRRLGRKEHH